MYNANKVRTLPSFFYEKPSKMAAISKKKKKLLVLASTKATTSPVDPILKLRPQLGKE
jgi:hypothetical protein